MLLHIIMFVILVSYVFVYKKELDEIIALSATADLYVPAGGQYELDHFEEAIKNSIDDSSQGKNIFVFKIGQE